MTVGELEAPPTSPGQAAGQANALIGRARELALLDDLLAGTGTCGTTLILAGEPGIGKSLLLDAGAARAAGAGFTVVRAAGAEFEAEVGFSALNQLLLPLLDRFAGLDAAHRSALSVALGLGTGSTPDRLVVGNAVLTLLRQVSARRPLLVVLDDLQWLDRQSAAVLKFVAARTGADRIVVLGAVRSDSAGLGGATGLPLVTLGPLADLESSELVTRRFPGLVHPIRERLLAEANGNPLALLELPSALSDAQRSGRDPLPPVPPLNDRLDAAFTAQVRRLPPGTRRVLLLAALEGRLPLTGLESAAGAAACWLSPALAAGLVRRDSAADRLEFRHPLIRAAAVAVSTHEERRLAHRRLAATLPDQIERRAWHLSAAADGPDEYAAEALEETAHLLVSRGDGVGGVTALVRAAELSPVPASRSRRLAEAAYMAAHLTGQLPEVSRLLRDAKRANDDEAPDGAASLHAVAAAAYLLLVQEGDMETAHRLLVAAIDSHAGTWDAADRALIDALDTLLLVCIYYGREDRWRPFHEAVARLQPAPPDDLALMSRILVRTAAGSLDRLDDEIRSLHQEDRWRISRISGTAVHVDRGSGCREVLTRIVRGGSRGAAASQTLGARGMLLVDLFDSGEWDETRRHVDEGLALCRTNEFGLMRWPFRSMQALLAAARGEDETLREAVEDMVAWAAPRGAQGLLVDVYWATALAAVGRGDFEEGYQQASLISPAGALVSHVPHAMWVCLALVEGAVRTGRHAEAEAHVTVLREAGMARVSSRMALLVAGCTAYTATDEDLGPAFEAALGRPDADHWPFDSARIRLVYGERLRRVRATGQARTQLSAALATFERFGARPWAARATAELRATGDRAPVPVGGLTPQERQVVELAAAGLGNREIAERLFLSPRTVGAHLYRAFPKLRVTARAGLRDALSGRRSG